MLSGELDELAGVTVRTLRHDRQIGLLPEPPRTAGGYRHYDVGHLVRLLSTPLQSVGEVLMFRSAVLPAAASWVRAIRPALAVGLVVSSLDFAGVNTLMADGKGYTIDRSSDTGDASLTPRTRTRPHDRRSLNGWRLSSAPTDRSRWSPRQRPPARPRRRGTPWVRPCRRSTTRLS